MWFGRRFSKVASDQSYAELRLNTLVLNHSPGVALVARQPDLARGSGKQLWGSQNHMTL